MTFDEFKEARSVHGIYKKYPFYFIEYPEVNRALELLPKALDEIEYLRNVLDEAFMADPYVFGNKRFWDR